MKDKYYVLAALALGGMTLSTNAEAAGGGCRVSWTGESGHQAPSVTCWGGDGNWGSDGWYGGGWYGGGGGWDSTQQDWNSGGGSDWGYDTLPTEPEKPDPCTKAGNPILVASGTKVEFENDFTGSEHFPLAVLRSYSSSKDNAGAFGIGWSSLFDKKLDLTAKTVFREDGQSLTLHETTFDIPHVGWKTGWVSSSWKNYLYQDASGLWILKTENDRYEVYNAQGQLLHVSVSERPPQINASSLVITPYGVSHSYSYVNNKLSSITHSNGRKLTFSWSGDRISSIQNNAGYQYSYSYQTNGMLNSVTFPDGATKSYHYEDSRFPTFLTGVTKGNKRFSYFSYDSAGRAIESKHAEDTKKNRFAFGTDTTTVTNPLGHKTTYFYDSAIKSKLKRVEKEGTAYCAASAQATTYNNNGQKETETDWNNKVTRYFYGEKNQVALQIKAYGEPEALTTSFTWHPTLNKVTEKQ